MEVPDLKHIRELRLQLVLTQTELAQKVGISQSMMNKIERELKQPSYQVAKRIFAVLTEIAKAGKQQRKIKEIASFPIVSLTSEHLIKDAVDKMGQNFDQLPILEKKSCIGSISSKKILHYLSEGGELTAPITVIMENPFPLVDQEETIDRILPILTLFEAILITKNRQITGIITRSDILKIIH